MVNMLAASVLFSFATSAFAYTVISPNSAQGWTNVGAQELTWQRVSTDPQNFTVVLTNQKIQGYTSQVLAALVDGTLGNTTLNPPAGGWTTGSGFQVNLVQNTTELNTIFAQSNQFNITAASGSSVTSTNAGTATLSYSAASPTQTSTSASSGATIAPANGASSMYPVQTVFLGVVALLVVALA